MIITECFFKEEPTPIKTKIRKVYSPKTLKQIARENFKMNDEEIEEKLAEKMINSYYFTDENLKIGFKINLESHNVNHANSILTITPKYTNFGIETMYTKKMLKEMATTYARLINQ